MTLDKDVEKTVVSVTSYSRRNLFLIAGCVYTLFINAGLIIGWASPALPKLKEEKNDFTNSQYALLGAINGLAPGPLLTIFGMDTIGRRWTLLVIWSTTVIGPAIMLTSNNINGLLTARFISGFGMSAAFPAIGIYIAEISDAGVRSALNSASLAFVNLGMVMDYCIGPFVSFSTFTLVSFLICSFFGIIWFYLPESPYYQISKGRTEEARSTLIHLRLGVSEGAVEKELAAIKFSIEEERENKSGFKKLFTSRAALKQLAISFYLLYLQQGAGVSPIGSYSQEIFDSSKLNLKGSYVTIGVYVFVIAVMLPLPIVLKKFGTKALFTFGGFGSGICQALLGVYFLFLEGGHDMSSISCLSIALVLSDMICAYVGLGGSVWGMVSELFAPSVKGAATGICGIFSTFLGFVIAYAFGELKSRYGFGATFLGLGMLQLVASVGLFFVVDTTKMTLQEIQDYFEGKTPTSKDKKSEGESLTQK